MIKELEEEVEKIFEKYVRKYCDVGSIVYIIFSVVYKKLKEIYRRYRLDARCDIVLYAIKTILNDKDLCESYDATILFHDFDKLVKISVGVDDFGTYCHVDNYNIDFRTYDKVIKYKISEIIEETLRNIDQ